MEKSKIFSVRINFEDGFGIALEKVDQLKAKILVQFPARGNLADALIFAMIENFASQVNSEVVIKNPHSMSFPIILRNGSQPSRSITAWTKEEFNHTGCIIDQIGEEHRYNYPTTDDRYETYKVIIKPKYHNSAVVLFFHSSYQSWDEKEDNRLIIYSLNKKFLKSCIDYSHYLNIKIHYPLIEYV